MGEGWGGGEGGWEGGGVMIHAPFLDEARLSFLDKASTFLDEARLSFLDRASAFLEEASLSHSAVRRALLPTVHDNYCGSTLLPVLSMSAVANLVEVRWYFLRLSPAWFW